MSRHIALALTLFLSACGTQLFDNPARKAQQQEVVVTSDKIRLYGAPGFCVDKESSAFGEKSAFVVFGNCAVIAGSSDLAQPGVQAIVTALVTTDPQSENVGPELAEFFLSEPGQQALARGDDPSDITVLKSFAENDTVYVLAEDRSNGAVAGTSKKFWRGYLKLGEATLGLYVIGFDEAPISDEEGRALLDGFVSAARKRAPAVTPKLVADVGKTVKDAWGRLFRR